MGLSYDHIIISFFFVGLWENHFGLANVFINLPLKLFNINFMCFFPKKNIFILNLDEQNLAGQERKKNIPTWHFHSIIIYKIVKNFFYSSQHFANLIKIRSTHLGRRVYCFTSVCLSARPSKILFVAFFSATIDGRNLVFGHKLHIGTPCHGKWQGYHKWALAHSSPCFN